MNSLSIVLFLLLLIVRFCTPILRTILTLGLVEDIDALIEIAGKTGKVGG
jgi:hypothetical protein